MRLTPDPDLADSSVEYVQQQGTVTMEEVVWKAPLRFWTMGLSQDKIGWHKLLEGMILTEITAIQGQFQALNRSCMSLEKWQKYFETRGLCTVLLSIGCVYTKR
jgi:hypothetical protein